MSSLSRPAISIIERCRELRTRECSLIFPGMKGDKPLSDMPLTKLLREMKQPYTAHGFRSAFRDWASEETDVQGKVAEAVLSIPQF